MSENIPEKDFSVVAWVEQLNDLGTSRWYEVVYHNGNEWCAYHGSDTFKNGESVIKWKYVGEVFNSNSVTATVTQKEFDTFFEKNILSQIDKLNTTFPEHNNFNHIKLFNCEWNVLFEYDYSEDNYCFWYSHENVLRVIQDKFSLEEEAVCILMRNTIQLFFKMDYSKLKNGSAFI